MPLGHRFCGLIERVSSLLAKLVEAQNWAEVEVEEPFSRPPQDSASHSWMKVPQELAHIVDYYSELVALCSFF